MYRRWSGADRTVTEARLAVQGEEARHGFIPACLKNQRTLLAVPAQGKISFFEPGRPAREKQSCFSLAAPRSPT